MQNNSNISMKPSFGGAIKPPRSSNLELYRIIVMFLIVCHHYVVNSGLIETMEAHSIRFGGEGGVDADIRHIFYFIFGAWGKTGINCFVLITGYFMCKSNITLRKFLKLILQVLFYNIAIFIVFFACGRQSVTLEEIAHILLPIGTEKDQFTGSFLLFWLSIPFLNALIQNLTRKQHLFLIVYSLFIYTLWEMTGHKVSINYLVWFSVIYIIASYIRLYGLYKDNNSRFWRNATMYLIIVSIITIVAPFFLPRHWCTWYFVSDSNHIMAIILAVTSFMWFKTMKIKNSKIINTIASTTFGILLIHANGNMMRQWLWYETIRPTETYYSQYFYLYSLFSVLTIFIICSLIDYIRIRTIEIPLINITERIIKK